MELEQTTTVGLTRDWQVKEKCESARACEKVGDYDGARQALNDVWAVIGERPVLDGLSPDSQAEVLLRVGTLTGFLGSTQQIAGAQELAKDLLSESAHDFEAIGDADGLAQAHLGLAVCYWREGAMDEARVCLQTALTRATRPATKLRILVDSTLPEVSTDHLAEALTLLDQAAPLLDAVTDDAVKGSYHVQRALTLKRLGGVENLDRALIENTAAAFHFEQAGHKRYVARVENNIGSLLLQFGRHHEALVHLERARVTQIALKDTGTAAQTNESRARVFLAMGRNAEAERAAFSAVTVLERGGEAALLAEALTAQGIARARLGRFQSAREIFLRAARTVELAGDRETSGAIYLTAIEELHGFYPAAEVAGLYGEADARLSNTSEYLPRLRSCAKITLDVFRAQPGAENDPLVGRNYRDEVKRFEADLIKRALDQSSGSVTRAAQALGISHQALSELIKTRHHSLQSARTPRKPRRRSIIKRI